MFMRMLYDESLAQASYLIGCQATGEAIVIDPLRDIDQYFKLASNNGLEIIAAADTHIHADYLSGVREICEQTAAVAYVSDCGDDDWKYNWAQGETAQGKPYNHQLLKDGDEFCIGNIHFRVAHTPGHTSEHICFVVTDRGIGATEPMGILTGDFIFVGDVGRPDLLESAAGMAGMMEPSARDLCSSLQKFDQYPDFLQVWPGHGSGSPCGKALGAIPQSTVGYEKRFNESIRLASDEEAFVESILSGQPEPPFYFARMKMQNRDGVPILGDLPKPCRMTCDEILDDAIVLDTRQWDKYCTGHLPGSLSMIPGKSFSFVAGAYIEPSQKVVVVANEQELNYILRMLVRVGIDQVIGWIPSDQIDTQSELVQLEEISVHELAKLDHPTVLDVRNRSEQSDGVIPGSTNVAYLQLSKRLSEVPESDSVYVHCRSGIRSARASSYLRSKGIRAVNVIGGYLAWEEADLPTITNNASHC